MSPTLVGVPEFERPLVDLRGDHSYWTMTSRVNVALKQAGFSQAALEFRRLAQEECDDDPGMLMSLALLFVRVPGQESV